MAHNHYTDEDGITHHVESSGFTVTRRFVAVEPMTCSVCSAQIEVGQGYEECTTYSPEETTVDVWHQYFFTCERVLGAKYFGDNLNG